MRFAYADPPYIGQAQRHYGTEAAADGRVACEVNHELLIAHLTNDFTDGWALSCSSPSLRYLLPLCPDDTRVMAWVKPFHAWKKGVTPSYAWEPVLVHGGRPRAFGTADDDGTRMKYGYRDFVSANITMQRGVSGAKPWEFCWWLFEVLNVQPGDELVDLFPGSGAVSVALDGYFGRVPAGPDSLFGEAS